MPFRCENSRALFFSANCRYPTLKLTVIDGAGERIRTSDLRITNALLYRLSYAGVFLHFHPARIRCGSIRDTCCVVQLETSGIQAKT